MIETFKSRLKAKFPGVNLSQKRIDAIADRLQKKYPDITEEKDHDEKIDLLYDEDEIKEIAKQDDRIRTLEAKPPKDEPKKDEPKPAEPVKSDDVPEWAKSLMDEVKSLKAEKTVQSIQAKTKEKLKDVPEKFWTKMQQPQKEEEIDAFVKEVSEIFAEVAPKQPGYQPGRANGSTPKPAEKQINSLVDELMGVSTTQEKN